MPPTIQALTSTPGICEMARRLRLLRFMIRRLLRATAITMLGTSAASAQVASTTPPFPAPGRLIDIGGWRLHLNCTGEAKSQQPTVILEAGIGDFSVEWSLVQPSVAKFARVCSYDRADDGWSDYGPSPRTMHQIVYEVHTLLAKAGERPPYVLVGHSYGGWLVRLYTATYPSDVRGMVLVEAGADDPVRVLGDGKPRRASELVTGKPIPEVKTSNPVIEAEIPPDVMSQLRGAALQYGPRANEAPRNKLPADAQQMRTWAYSQPKHWAQGFNPFEADELAGLRAERAKTESPYGDLPLIVLTRGISDSDGPDSKAFEEEHRRDHSAVTKLSRNGKLIVATHSGHHVQIDEPELVISAIREVVSATRK
jgi:pimeloyl-ACP methyl ester carboxylesterase